MTEFHIDFSFAVYNDWWRPWHAKFLEVMLFLYFLILAFVCTYSQPTKIMLVDTKNKNGKQILQLTDFASYDPIG